MNPPLILLIALIGLLAFALFVQATTYVVYRTVVALRDYDARHRR